MGHGCSLLAELKAIFLGLQLASTCGLLFVMIESDCKLAVDLINSPDAVTHHFANLILSIRLKAAVFLRCSIHHILREANSPADVMAKFALEKKSPYVSFDVMPSFIFSAFHADCSGVALPRVVSSL